ncbi:transposase InsO family protein [Undibacterium sp. GrIS 1.2]
MKYAWMKEHRKQFDLNDISDALDVSLSSYRAWQRGGVSDRKHLGDSQLLRTIESIHTQCKGAYGSPRIVRELRSRGLSASKARVERLMREHGIRARHKQRYKFTTDSKHGLPVAENLLVQIRCLNIKLFGTTNISIFANYLV